MLQAPHEGGIFRSHQRELLLGVYQGEDHSTSLEKGIVFRYLWKADQGGMRRYLPRIREGMFSHNMTCVHPHERQNDEVHRREMTPHQGLFTMEVKRPNRAEKQQNKETVRYSSP